MQQTQAGEPGVEIDTTSFNSPGGGSFVVDGAAVGPGISVSNFFTVSSASISMTGVSGLPR